MVILEGKNVTKKFAGLLAVGYVDFYLQQGEIHMAHGQKTCKALRNFFAFQNDHKFKPFLYAMLTNIFQKVRNSEFALCD